MYIVLNIDGKIHKTLKLSSEKFGIKPIAETEAKVFFSERICNNSNHKTTT